ncbi:AAA family ATPase [Pleurocapsa sp. PCC 7319]|uniref:AAA family ATPase n=1 Tax=Pleurocapsa sp. PCC 7319 TaxID=118161 RepID=UPI00034DA337|nr:AAA family ATPase [Pleurocapsa sp. PCC 7319]
MKYYKTSLQHLLAELERIDLLIQVQLQRLQTIQSSDPAFQGLYISEPELKRLLEKPLGVPHWAAGSTPLSSKEIQNALDKISADIAQKKTASSKKGIELRLDSLGRKFQLTPTAIDILLICLAPELDLRYQSAYGYLQGDVTKKRPSVDLVLNLLCPDLETKLEVRQRFTASAPLLKYHLIDIEDDSLPLLSRHFNLGDRLVNYLLNNNEIDSRISVYTQYRTPSVELEDLLLPTDIKQRFIQLTENKKVINNSIFYFQGAYGVGKQSTAEAICYKLGMGLLVIEGERLFNLDLTEFKIAIDLIHREGILQQAAIYWQECDRLWAEEKQPWLSLWLRQYSEHHTLTFLSGNEVWEPADALQNTSFLRIEFPYPTTRERIQLWEQNLNGTKPDNSTTELQELASKFRFSGGQIEDAAATARNLALWQEPETKRLTMSQLYEACRLQSNRKLSKLAKKVRPHYQWSDIILPADQIQILREICNTLKYRSLVYEDWGFDRKLAMGKGINVFFAGLPGTGKTMAADIIAGELGLELYKIDLSSIVSKYIGETEKNLSRIFDEAQTSNAILFFDEADSLFGKRSEVRDSHDRYANIEVSYLLQRMEEYRGMVILATNLRGNLDDAFIRRMHFSLEFPFPSVKDRCRIWSKILPADTPISPDLNLDLMAQRFEIAGGNIRNIALAAAFLAADDGAAIAMKHLLWATRREYQKMGRVVANGEFELLIVS